ncbi:hypothetical protein BC830DRAFT_400101 [Chytriomyces sp. MP71]|nr:hypothetical protein BC830DRAFT_400101 [Chytriomyces sp. MP71]
MHLIHSKRAGQDLPKTLPANLVPPSTRELDSITSIMKTQVMSDMMNKKPTSRGMGAFVPDDPLAAGFSPQGSRSSVTQRMATKEEREEERKIRAAELELKKKELAIVNNRLEAAQSAFKDMSRDIDKAKRDAINAHDDLVFSLDSRETLVDQVRSMIPDPKTGGGSSTAAVAESQITQLEREIQALLEDCKEINASNTDYQIRKVKEQDLLRGGSGSAPIQSAAEKANAVLAARMAALGVNAPQLNVSTPTASAAAPVIPSSLTSDIRKIEDAKVGTDRELEDTAIRVRGLVSNFRSIAQTISNSGARSPSATKGFSASAILSSLKSWEPPIETKIKYEEGVGLRSEEVREVVLDMKKKSSKGTYITKSATLQLVSRSSLSEGFSKGVEAMDDRRKSNNPFTMFSQQSTPSVALGSTSPPAPPKPNEVSAPALANYFPESRNSAVAVAVVAVPVAAQPSAAATATTNAVNDVVAQAQAAIRAAKERASARTASNLPARASVIAPAPIISEAPSPVTIPQLQSSKLISTPFGPVSPNPFTGPPSIPLSSSDADAFNPFGGVKAIEFPHKSENAALLPPPITARGVAPPPPSKTTSGAAPAPSPVNRGAAPPLPVEQNATPPPLVPATRAPPPTLPAARIVPAPPQPAPRASVPPPTVPGGLPIPQLYSAVSDISKQADDLTRAAKAARGALSGLFGDSPQPTSSMKKALDLPPTVERGMSVKDFKNFNPFGGGFEKTTSHRPSGTVAQSVSISKIDPLDLPPTTERGMSVKDFKNFNPFGGGFGKSVAETAFDSSTVAVNDMPEDMSVASLGGPPPPPPPPPALLPSIAAAASAVPAIIAPPPPPPPQPTPVGNAQKQRSASPSSIARTHTNSPSPAVGVTSLLKSALMKVRGAHASDDDDDSDENNGDDDDDDWGASNKPKPQSSTSAPNPMISPPPPPPSSANPYAPPSPRTALSQISPVSMSSPVEVSPVTLSPVQPFPVAKSPHNWSVKVQDPAVSVTVFDNGSFFIPYLTV